jgi:hypothetical protein
MKKINILAVKHKHVDIPTQWSEYLTQNWHTTRTLFSNIRERKELSIRWLLKKFPDITETEKEQAQLWVDDNLGVPWLK